LQLDIKEKYMYRCLELARLGAGYTTPNPMVGAVLVHEERIIGEGRHEEYGKAHAEVNCIGVVKEEDGPMIPLSTLFVSLEPCSHFGKTPPCTDLIIKNKIPKVIIGCRDPFKEVDGKGIEKLKAAGIELEVGILENECRELNKRFFTFNILHRPYVILKWAQTGDGFIGASPQTPLPERGASEDNKTSRLFISNEYSNRLVHRWRSEEASLLVGTNTAMHDDPELTTRLWPGKSPIRLLVDMDLKLPSSLRIFNDASPTIIFNTKVHSKESEWLALGLSAWSSHSPTLKTPIISERAGVRSLYYQVPNETSLVPQILNALYQLKIQSVLVEGGARLLQSFIDEETWDEARVISNMQLTISKGLAAPKLENAIKIEEQNIFSDNIEIFKPVK
jgi:diaminohydroxyphosphoribosylaminopyrimidine deaminase/5-amino-6-(5-phosphoribosylamino)uracil reductase